MDHLHFLHDWGQNKSQKTKIMIIVKTLLQCTCMYILVQNIAASWIKTRAQKLADPTLTLLFYICPENVWVKYNGTW